MILHSMIIHDQYYKNMAFKYQSVQNLPSEGLQMLNFTMQTRLDSWLGDSFAWTNGMLGIRFTFAQSQGGHEKQAVQ